LTVLGDSLSTERCQKDLKEPELSSVMVIDIRCLKPQIDSKDLHLSVTVLSTTSNCRTTSLEMRRLFEFVKPTAKANDKW
jgi:hypothetical protein